LAELALKAVATGKAGLEAGLQLRHGWGRCRWSGGTGRAYREEGRGKREERREKRKERRGKREQPTRRRGS
jgi:hypothetical protein